MSRKSLSALNVSVKMAFRAYISPACLREQRKTEPKAPRDIGAIISKSLRRGGGRGALNNRR